MAIETAVPLLKRRRTRIVATIGPASSDADTLDALLLQGVDVFRRNFSHRTHEDHAATHARLREVARPTRTDPTRGPASSDADTLDALLLQGVDVFRLNFSHGTHEDHAATHARILEAASRTGTMPAVLADLCGPKIRAGRFENGAIVLESGAEVTITTRQVTGTAGLIPSAYAGIADDVAAGARVLLDDGKLELEVLAVEGTEIRCRVRHGGVLKDRKGINLPDSAVSAPSLTAQDEADARFALGLGVDWLALSFVRSAEDILALRGIVDASGTGAGIVAKIEKPEALKNFDGILDACDAVMVARGDLGVELLPEQVPVAQDLLVRQARARHRPVIVATQMLESMIQDARPTRAEVSDVAHAVMSGTDAVMLSAETASGAHPVAAVTMMDRIARQAEGWLWSQGAFGTIIRERTELDVAAALATATAQLSRDLGVRAIMVVSRTGLSAQMMSAARPAAPIVALSADPAVCRRLRLSWGLVPVQVDADALADPASLALATAQALDLAPPGTHLLLVQGFNLDPALARPSVTVLTSP